MEVERYAPARELEAGSTCGLKELDHWSELLTIACVARSYRASHLPAKAKQGRSAVYGGFVVLALPQSAM
jgi:hypothetical protein